MAIQLLSHVAEFTYYSGIMLDAFRYVPIKLKLYLCNWLGPICGLTPLMSRIARKCQSNPRRTLVIEIPGHPRIIPVCLSCNSQVLLVSSFKEYLGNSGIIPFNPLLQV